ncbi:MAG: DNA translocase FtsK [Erysipelotrichales bacterium]
MAKKRKTKKQIQKQNEIILYIVAIIAIAIMLISVFQLGFVGVFIDKILKNTFGTIPYYFIIIQLIIYCGYILVQGKVLSLTSRFAIGSFFFTFGIILLFACIDSSTIGFEAIDMKLVEKSSLGILQLVLFGLFSKLFGLMGTYLFAVVFIIIAIIIYFMISISTLLKDSHKAIQDKRVDHKQQRAVKQIKKDEIKKEALQKATLENEAEAKKVKDFFKEDSKNEVVEHDNEKQLFIDKDNEIKEDEEIPFDLDDEIVIDKKIKLNKEDYNLPSFDLLSNPKASDALSINQKNANEKAILLVNILKEFNLDVEVSKINIGPAITKFELTLSAGTRVSRVASLADDIKMALAVKELRIEAPIPGKSAVGIEIPNVKNTLITLKEVLKDIDYDKENKLVFGLGKDINGKAIYTNLNKMPHLLVAGSTGSGKSVCINCIITSILMNAHYDDVKLLLVDPKKVELNVYNDIPHLLAPVVTDPKSASIALRKIVEEMDLRYQILANHNCKNIESYNEFVEKFNEKVDDESTKMNKLPYIVVIIDELADLMMVSPKEVEESIMRITQMARAAGIHLIVATQRPSTDVITGIIKANIPSRIAFAVSSSIDSRTILDMSGAEKLLGKGDMLFHPTGMSSPQRLQGAFLSDEEVEKVVRSIKKQNIESVINETFDNLNSEGNQGDNQVSSEDEIYFEVEDFVKRQDTISTSRLQREFKIGYNRAARLIDELEENGIIGAQSGSKPRDVFVRNEELE